MNIATSFPRLVLSYLLSSLPAALASETVVLDFESPLTGIKFPGGRRSGMNESSNDQGPNPKEVSISRVVSWQAVAAVWATS